MYSATFIFETKQFDDDFHRLDALIAKAAKESIGYLGEEAWEDPKAGPILGALALDPTSPLDIEVIAKKTLSMIVSK